MGSHGVRDKVAIVGMGCTKFAELWEKGLDDLIVDASTEAFASAGVNKEDVDAYWFGTAQSGMSGITLARPLHAASCQAVISLLAASGMRIGEAVKLTRHDVDLDAGVLTVVRGKYGASRYVPLHPSTVAMLRKSASISRCTSSSRSPMG